ncbi:MAG: ClbS/DfsB family four-helix bundle protein [Jiangellales bacterium]
MGRPATRDELLARIDSDFEALWRSVETVPGPDRQRGQACGDWTVKDLLAHLDAWHEMFLAWEAVGRAGGKPPIPAPGLTWKQTPQLNEQIWLRTRDDSWDDVAARLTASHARIRDVVASYSHDDLFTKKRFEWTGSTSVGSYATSATTSHYDWARKQVRAYAKALQSP